MKVAGIQMDIDWEAPKPNLDRARDLARKAVAAGAELIVFPEMFATGFSMAPEKILGFSSQINEGMQALALEIARPLIYGVAVPGATRPENHCLVLDATGKTLATYAKIHPFSLAGEDLVYGSGQSLATFSLGGLRVTPLICYDLRFPELFRVAAADTDLFVVIANWPSKRRFAWQSLLACRALENQAYVLGVNRMGVDGNGFEHHGDSALHDPFGASLGAMLGGNILIGEVDRTKPRKVRQEFSFLADRRNELYRELEENWRRKNSAP